MEAIRSAGFVGFSSGPRSSEASLRHRTAGIGCISCPARCHAPSLVFSSELRRTLQGKGPKSTGFQAGGIGSNRRSFCTLARPAAAAAAVPYRNDCGVTCASGQVSRWGTGAVGSSGNLGTAMTSSCAGGPALITMPRSLRVNSSASFPPCMDVGRSLTSEIRRARYQTGIAVICPLSVPGTGNARVAWAPIPNRVSSSTSRRSRSG